MSRSSTSNLSSLGYFCNILTIVFVFCYIGGKDVNEWRVRQRKEQWSTISAFPALRSLVLQQTGSLQIINQARIDTTVKAAIFESELFGFPPVHHRGKRIV